jgi:DNA-binding NtrC family response regulator
MPHALIVDGDAHTRAMLSEPMAGEGFTTAVAASLREVRREMAVRAPDVVLVDLVLPDGSGMDLFADVESRATTEIVPITGHATLEGSIEALRLGAADYLVKPVGIAQAKGILSRVTRPTDVEAEINRTEGTASVLAPSAIDKMRAYHAPTTGRGT